MVRSIIVCLVTLIVYCAPPARCGETVKAGQTSSPSRTRALGIVVGTMKPGSWNNITDVPGVRVGHKTLFKGTDIRTGVTAVLPHGGNLFQEKVPAAVIVGNGFGKLAGSTQVEEGCVGAGTGTIAFWFKGGIGTSSRVAAVFDNTEYTVGVLVQSNFGGLLEINGAPVWKEMQPPPRSEQKGSCMIVVATDAPLSPRNLKRLARRALLGLARTGSYMSNGSGDYVIAFSTAYRIPYHSDGLLPIPPQVPNDAMSPLFRAVVEATQESVYNSMFMATTVTGRKGRTIHAIPIDEAVDICRKYGAAPPLEK